jgi:hypothetical protein
LIAKAEDMVIDCQHVLNRGYLDGHSFKFNIPINNNSFNVQAIQSVVSSADEELCQLQLQRLGFAGPTRILEAFKDSNRNKLKLPLHVDLRMFHVEESDGYQFGKQTALPHRNLHGAKSSGRPYELLHIDIKIINERTYGGRTMAVIIVDDYSREKSCILLRSRDEIHVQLLRWYRTEVQSRGYTTSRIRLDNAGEHISENFKSFI